MSYITDIILLCNCGDDGQGYINHFVPNAGCAFNLVDINDPKLPECWYGGTKVFTPGVWIGAINSFYEFDAFLGHLRSIKWECPECVQVLVKHPNDVRFTFIQVFGNSASMDLYSAEPFK